MSAKKASAKSLASPAPKPAVASSSRKSGLEMDPEGDESSWLSPVLKYSALGLICLISFSIRLFAVARWESVSSWAFSRYYVTLYWFALVEYRCYLAAIPSKLAL
jgi:hypothetical protein